MERREPSGRRARRRGRRAARRSRRLRAHEAEEPGRPPVPLVDPNAPRRPDEHPGRVLPAVLTEVLDAERGRRHAGERQGDIADRHAPEPESQRGRGRGLRADPAAHRSAGYGVAVDDRQGGAAARDELLRAREVVLVVDVEALVALGEEGREHAPLARAGRLRRRASRRSRARCSGRRRSAAPGTARVPGDVEVGLVEQRPHRAGRPRRAPTSSPGAA